VSGRGDVGSVEGIAGRGYVSGVRGGEEERGDARGGSMGGWVGEVKGGVSGRD